MYFKQIVTSVGFSIMICVFISNLDGVPQAVTKAPGESNHNSCATCHDVKGIYEPAIALDVMKTDSTLVHTYTPGETYIVRVRVSATNNPRAYGFQMACLDSLTNSDLGVWSGLGDKVKQQTLFVQQKQRKYLVQSAPKTNGIFTANWKAPGTDVGKIKFYFTGLAVNLNGNTNGDNNVFNQLTLDSPSTSSVTDIEWSNDCLVYPNPVQSFLTISNKSVSSVNLIGLSSSYFNSFNPVNSTLDLRDLPNGLYVIVFKDSAGQVLYRQKLIKN